MSSIYCHLPPYDKKELKSQNTRVVLITFYKFRKETMIVYSFSLVFANEKGVHHNM